MSLSVTAPSAAEIFDADPTPHPADVLARPGVRAIADGYASACGYRAVAQAALEVARAERLATDALRARLRAALDELRQLRAATRSAA